jgi:hypothetical protein
MTRLLLPALALVLTVGCKDAELLGARFLGTPQTQTVAEEPYAYQSQVSAVRPPASYELTAAPAGMAVDGDGLITWSPGFADLGTHPVRLEATDGENTAVLEYEVRVHQGLDCGLGYSPAGHTGGITAESDEAFFGEAFQYGRLVAFRTAWRDDLASAGDFPAGAVLAMERRASYGVTPVVTFSWADEDGVPDLTSEADGATNSWANEETRDEFREMVRAFAQTYAPRYLGLAHELNTWWLADGGAGYADWLTQLEECADEIRAVSPGTTVFVSFQLERIQGLGANAGWADPAHWQLVSDLEGAELVDAVGFTSYPYLEFAAPAQVPPGHYDAIATAGTWTGPILLTEVAWSAQASGPYPGSEADQEAFAQDLFPLLEGLEVDAVLWRHLHDLDAPPAAYTAVGLRSNDGALVRPADDAWKAEVQLRSRP